MDRHRTDYVELFFGLVFIASGAGFVVHQATDRTFDAAWIAAIALVTIGSAFLAVTLLHRPRSEPATMAGIDIPEPSDRDDETAAPFGDAAPPADGS